MKGGVILIEKEQIFGILAMVGVVTGILYVNFYGFDYLTIYGIFNQVYLEGIQANTTINYTYILPILLIRLVPVGYLLLITYAPWHKIGVYLLCMWTGFLLGIYISLGVIQQGIQGAILCFIGVFPQIILYLPAYLILLIFAYKYPKSVWRKEKSWVVILCLCGGVLLECEVNPIILKWYVSLFM